MMLHNAYGYGPFTGGLGLHDGGERLGLTMVPVSGGMTERQLTLIGDLRPDVISCTPSYAPHARARLRRTRRGPGRDQPPVRSRGGRAPDGEHAPGDRCGPRGSLHESLRALRGPSGPASPASASRSARPARERVTTSSEIVDPESGEFSLPEGKEGVLVFTTLTK